MDKDKKKMLAGAGILGGVGLYYLLTKQEAEPPPPPGYGRVQGYIIDEETGDKISNAEILVDDKSDCYSDYHGFYRTGYMEFGTHVLTVNANNYQTATFNITLMVSLLDANLVLSPVPEAPTEWTEGIEIISITVEPSLVYVGETVDIDVYIHYPHPLELPADIYGTVLVNGQSITGEWTITFRNPTLRFQYTATSPGDFTVRALDKSASFTVLQDIPSTYYSPFGGVRMPICTEITVPHPGGDYVMKGVSEFTAAIDLSEAYPTAWAPPEAVVANWVTFQKNTHSLLIMATDYTCQEYWDSKEELARMIATGVGQIGLKMPKEWTKVDLRRGLRDWVEKIRWGSICGGGVCTPHVYCRYCDTKIYGPSYTQALPWDKVSLARKLLSHIETVHPDHPLTEPAWF